MGSCHDSCIYKDTCSQECGNDFCQKKFKLDYLFKCALLSDKQKLHKKISLDNDCVDEEAFNKLYKISKNIVSEVSNGINIFIHSQIAGNGKAQPEDAVIFTMCGYKSFKEIAVGDKIYGEDGRIHTVINKFYRGVRKIYKVTFTDDTSTECCDEHLWNVVDRKNDYKIKTIELKDIIGTNLKNKGGYRFAIPVTECISFKGEKTANNPYEVGKCIVSCISEDDADNTIPETYKYNTKECRVSLLQGIFDAKGFVNKKSHMVYYKSPSKQLSDDIKFIVQSLGGICKIDINDKATKNKYFVKCCFPESIAPFRDKMKSYKYLSNDVKVNPYRSIKSIEYVGDKKCYCISTDNPSELYLTNDLIVTHNTMWSLRLLQEFIDGICDKSSLRCRALFISVPKFLSEYKSYIKSPQPKSTYIQDILDNVENADLVIWDDIATKQATTFEADVLFNMIDARLSNGKSNIFTSNLNDSELHESLGDRLYSRICSSSRNNNIEFFGGDKRGMNI